MNFQNNSNGNDQFIISKELINLMQNIIDLYSESFKEVIAQAQKNTNPQNSEFDLQDAQDTILEFLNLMEMLSYEIKHENIVTQHLQLQLMPSINHIDQTTCDEDTVISSIEDATDQMEKNPKANPQELLYKELLKRWTLTKNTVKH